jgi:uncharacterized protein YbbC (DUF1343 family)
MTSRVRTGLEMLVASGFRSLRGLHIGLVTNPSGVLPDLTSTIETLYRAPGVRLCALFGPEHGVRGDVPAGDWISSSRDPETGLPVYSLYGPTLVPNASMLSGLDLLVFDIQDIGSRSYTYLSTLGCVLEGASAHGVPVLVLDRPNPLGLERVEGGPVRPGFASFVGKYPVSYLHGMTLGELAKMIVGRGWLPVGRTADVTVVPCDGLKRDSATWADMGGLPWVPTSPHIPRAESAYFYAATGITGELSTVSIGVGYPLPFELAGAPDIGPAALARLLARRGITGWAFRPANWTPFYAAYHGKNCGGVQLYVTDPRRVSSLTRINFEILDAFRALHPGRSFFTDSDATRLFDLDCGTDRVRRAFQSGASAADLWAIFNDGAADFARARGPYLLYG